jgi:hypothetical protein
MSATIMPESGVRPGRRLAGRARVAVAAAWLLSAMPPAVIRRVLTLLVRGADRPDLDRVLVWRGAVNNVSRRCAGKGCLQRSIAVMLLARSHGVSPVWKTGFMPDPFIAHAWVEVDGSPAGEPEAVAGFHTVLAVVPMYRSLTKGA